MITSGHDFGVRVYVEKASKVGSSEHGHAQIEEDSGKGMWLECSECNLIKANGESEKLKTVKKQLKK